MSGPAGSPAPDGNLEGDLSHLPRRARVTTLLVAWAVLGCAVLAAQRDVAPALRLPLVAYLFLVAPGSCLLIGPRMRIPADRLLFMVLVVTLSVSVNVLLAQLLVQLGRLSASSHSVGLGALLLISSLAASLPRRHGPR